MKTKLLLLTCLLIATVSQSAVPDFMHKFPKGVKANPMVIQDSFGDYIVLSNYLGWYFLDKKDASFHKIEYPKPVAKLTVTNVEKNDGEQLTLRMSDSKGKKLYDLTVDKQLNVLSCEQIPVDAASKTKSTPNRRGMILYSEDGKYYIESKAAEDFKIKEKARTGAYSFALYSADGTELSSYSMDWKTPANEYHIYQNEVYQKDMHLVDGEEVVSVLSCRRMDLGEGDFWKGWQEDPTPMGGCDLKIIILKADGTKHIIDLPNVDDKHFIENMHVLSYKNDVLHIVGWYCNLDEKNKFTSTFGMATTSPFIYQGAYSMLIDTKNEKVIKYQKAPKTVRTTGRSASGRLIWLPFTDNEFSWYRFDDGWRFSGLGCRIPSNAYVTDDGDISIPRYVVATQNTFNKEVWKDHANLSNKTFIPLGYDSVTQTYNFVVHDYDVKTGNGVYMRSFGKQVYLMEHVNCLLDNDTQPINQVSLLQKGSSTLTVDGIYAYYSVHKVSANKILLFCVQLYKNTYYFVYDELDAPDIRDVTPEEIAAILAEPEPEENPVRKVMGTSLKSKMNMSE